MSTTPRTDAEALTHAGRLDAKGYFVSANFARTLERELAAVQQQASSYAEQTALAITQRDALTARAEAAESLVTEKDKAFHAIIKKLYDAPFNAENDRVSGYIYEASNLADAALALTPASMVSKLAELEKTLDTVLHGNEEGGLRYWISKHDDLLVERVKQDAELARLREEEVKDKQNIKRLHALNETFVGIEQRAERLADALRIARTERTDLIDGICQGCSMIREIINEHFDEDPGEGESYCPEGEALRNLSHHLEGTCIGDDGEYMARDKFDAALADQPAQRTIGSLSEAESESAVQAFCLSQPAQANTQSTPKPAVTELIDGC